MGKVYQAQDTRFAGRLCAIKGLSEAGIPPAERAEALADFQKEANLLAQLDHSGLTKVSDLFNEGGRWYLVMEYVDGETLEAIAQHSGRRMPEATVITWALQLCDVLAYLHSRNPPVIFRDIKPSNIMLTPDGRIKLIDFGIARFFKPGQTRDTRNMGTPGFAAPEQYGKGQTDGRSDIYSLGVTLHCLLTEYDCALTPFNLPPPRSLNPAISSGMEHLIQRATQVDRELRFCSVGELRAALAGVGQPARPQTAAPIHQADFYCSRGCNHYDKAATTPPSPTSPVRSSSIPTRPTTMSGAGGVTTARKTTIGPSLTTPVP